MSHRNLIYILLLIIFLINVFSNRDVESFQEEKKHYDVIISINVHEKIDFLQKQLENIRENVKCKYAVILNCNYHMFNECNLIDLPNNIYIHNKILNKRTWHGSLTEGIYNNICYAIEHFKFDYFIVASSRNFFGNDMKLEHLNKLFQTGKIYTYNSDNKTWHNIDEIKVKDKNDWNEKKNTGHWSTFKRTLLLQYFINKNQELYSSPHEGLVFTEKCCVKIMNFLENNYDMKIDLFNFEYCVEEFALQTISMNLGEPYNYIGNCCYNDQLEQNNYEGDIIRFMYKVNR